MPGLKHVSSQLEDVLDEQKELAGLRAAGKKVSRPAPRHLLMIGPPGTGKSMTAQMIADAYSLMGITKTNKVTSIKVPEIVGRVTGDAETNMSEAIASAGQGVLLVDEAHQFKNSVFGQRALQTLIQPMADPNNKMVVIFAGYPGEMEEMLKVDPGLPSRFGGRLNFDEYGSDALIEIMLRDIPGKWNLNLGTKNAVDAMESAMELVSSTPDNASVRDAQKMVAFANKARIQRIRGKELSEDKALTFSPVDWKAAMHQWRTEHEG